MKFFGICVFVVSVLALTLAFSEEKKRKIQKFHDECQANGETHLWESLVANVKNGRASVAELTRAGKHNLCMNVKMGIQKENGDIDSVGLRREMQENTDHAKVQEIMRKCVTRVGATPGDAALHLSKCMDGILGVTPLQHC